MNNNVRKRIKFIYKILSAFLIINVLFTPLTFAAFQMAAFPATVVKILVVASQILVVGFFIVRLTLLGIQYFIAVAAQDKAVSKEKIGVTLFWGVIAVLAMRLFLYALGL